MKKISDFISHSQHADDYIAWQLLGKERNGLVVEVGAFDGIHFSNSYSLEQLGWKAICIEANPAMFNFLKKNRPEAINIQSAIVGDTDIKEIEFFSEEIGVLSGCAYDEEDVRQRYINRGLEYREPEKINVRASTLNSIFEDVVLHDPVIDLLSIDVEGLEMEVLRGLDLSRFDVKLFIIEANNSSFKERILEFFADYPRYIHIGDNHQNLFIGNKNFLRRRSVRELDLKNYVKARQHHPVDQKYVKDSILPFFQKSEEAFRFQSTWRRRLIKPGK